MCSVCLCVCIGWQDLCQRYVCKHRVLKGRKKSHSRLVESVVQGLQQLAFFCNKASFVMEVRRKRKVRMQRTCAKA